MSNRRPNLVGSSVDPTGYSNFDRGNPYPSQPTVHSSKYPNDGHARQDNFSRLPDTGPSQDNQFRTPAEQMAHIPRASPAEQMAHIPRAGQPDNAHYNLSTGVPYDNRVNSHDLQPGNHPAAYNQAYLNPGHTGGFNQQLTEPGPGRTGGFNQQFTEPGPGRTGGFNQQFTEPGPTGDYNPLNLGVGSLIEYGNPPMPGVIKWIGHLPGPTTLVAGVEMVSKYMHVTAFTLLSV